jgi:hypothetical protein
VLSAFFVGVTLALLAIGYVLYPLLRSRQRRSPRPFVTQPARPVTDEEIEAAVRAYRAAHPVGGPACPACGARPEPDAIFCSTCGRGLEGISPPRA